MVEAFAMERLVIYVVLKDYVMNCYTRELLILFTIKISLLCHAYKSLQFFCRYFTIISKKKSDDGVGRTKQVFVRHVFL